MIMAKNKTEPKTIYGSSKGLILPKNVMRLIIGAEIRWQDDDPLSDTMDYIRSFYFDSHTKPSTDLLLRRYGISDVGQLINVKCRWLIHIELYYSTPNNKEKSHHIDHHWFEMSGTIFPMSESFKKQRDAFYIERNLDHLGVPSDNKNKGYYQTTHFHAMIIGA